jgi:deoxyadenosine/deoxycytidine kinase
MRVVIDGLIGAGKSTVLDALQQRGLSCHKEPIDDWGRLLDMFYSDPGKWAFAFNLRVLLSSSTPDDDSVVLCERFPMSTRFVFIQHGFNSGKISFEEFDVLKAVYETVSFLPDLLIFLEAPTPVLLERIRGRGRACEADVTDDYLTRLKFQYDNMLSSLGEAMIPIIRIDTSCLTPSEVADAVHAHIASHINSP